jgi:lipopolysaccharide transport system permease protein/teichoic acid transport system permease protein
LQQFFGGYVPQMINWCKAFIFFWIDLLKSWRLILTLTQRDFKANYLGSHLSFVWNFIQPCITLAVLYTVFQIGFRAAPIDGHAFFPWLIAGMLPWFFLSDSMGNATNSILAYSYLVKKVVFRVSILPIIKIASALVVHIFFVMALFIILLTYGYKPSIFQLQIFYYLFASLVLLLGVSWITSSLTVFIRDVGQIVSALLQIGFWLTPILWNSKVVPIEYQRLIELNPAFYIVEGYRDSFLYHTWFWQYPFRMLYFWIITTFLFIIGAIIFIKLRPHFADVL